MADRPTALAERSVSFGPFHLLPLQRLLLEGETPVRLGSRALEILIALVEQPGVLVSKNDLTARIWPDIFVDENTLRVHVAGLRKALGDGQPGRRYLANVPGRGYRFVATINFGDPAPEALQSKPTTAAHNLPLLQARAVGRGEVIEALLGQLPKRRFITIVGAGGIGKTVVALTLAEALLPTYRDGIRFVDLAPLDDSRFVPNALGTAFGLAVHSDDAIPQLIDSLRDKQVLIVLDSCEHFVEAAAALAEQLLGGAPGVHILATSREPLRAAGERVHRLSPLDTPALSTALTAANALAFPSVRLFVERAAAILDGFELNDEDAPIVADICRKLGGIALAIELAAARVDAFSIRQLSILLDDRFRILKQGRRTAQPRHQSLAAALDWSYEFLPEVERVILCRLAVFAGGFTLESAIVVGGDGNPDVVEGVANLVAKSLISADVGGVAVQYRLLDTTRAYAMQKLVQKGEFDDCARRHAQYYLDWSKRAGANWAMWATVEWLDEYGRRIDDVRSALHWTFSPNGDVSVGIAITVASLPLWVELSAAAECREHIENALTSVAGQPTHNERDELKLLVALALISPYATRSTFENDDFWANALALSEKLGDYESQGQVLFSWSGYCRFSGDLREALALAKKCSAIADKAAIPHLGMFSHVLIGNTLQLFGDYEQALRHISPIVDQADLSNERQLVAYRSMARHPLSHILWLQGFPDQAVRCARAALDEARLAGNPPLLSLTLGVSVCPIALSVGNLTEAESSIAMLLDCSAKSGLNNWSVLGHCLKGILLLARDDSAGLAILQTALDWLREARFVVHYTLSLGALAQGLAAAGQIAEARAAIDEALERSDRTGERWCMPELLRIKGELLRLNGAANGDEAAEDYFQQALDWARRQEALSWELRAAMSLAKLWRDNGKLAEADESLSDVYNRFTEGFETSDLRAARALMEEFRGRPS